MRLNSVKKYLIKLIKDGHKWQYIDLNGSEEKPKFYFSTTQFMILIISTYGFYLMPKEGFNSDFVGYVISALSIFVGLFLTLILSVFDKFQNLKRVENPTEADKIYLIQRQNFFKQFTSLTAYAILISLICIVSLSIILLSKSLNENIFNYTIITNLQEISSMSLITFFKLFLIAIYNITIIYFLLDFLLIVLFAVASIHTYMMIEFNKANNE